MSRALRAEYLILLFSLLIVAAYNQSLWREILSVHPEISLHNGLFLFSCVVFLTALCNLLFNLFGLVRIVKPALIFFVICSALASYFMDSYGVQIDSTMLQNVMETDSAEATELFSMRFMIHFLLFGALPAWLIYKIPVNYFSWKKQTVIHLFSMTMSVLAIGLVAAFFYQDYASTFRNHRELRYLINPTNYISATEKLVRQQFAVHGTPLQRITQNSALGYVAAKKQHRAITVLVVGETARAEQFHINGYQRDTTPKLEKLNLINFSNVSSCGTSTAVSLPCMFSMFDRDDYDNEKGHSYENLLDVVAASGTRVVWLDNNSGCKGICDRVEYTTLSHLQLPKVCNAEECYDEVLLKAMRQVIEANEGDLLIVLHQKGSHGPAYYKRVPAEFERYGPVCQTSELQQCEREQIVNAYDNTILYTDNVLSDIVNYLQQLSKHDSTAMLYVSDHGESLGEHGMYLHGTPYLFAPSQQTHVPMMLWLSDNYQHDFMINEGCVRGKDHDALSQDNFFYSVLGMMDIKLPELYKPDLDIFATCRPPSFHL